MDIRGSFATSVLVVVLASTGCGGGFWSVADHDGTLEDSVRTYAKLVRWGEIERASLFVDESVRADFAALAPALARLHFTDFDIGPVTQVGEGEARLTVVYRFYDVNTLVEREIAMPQTWVAAGRRDWSVQPDLSGFHDAIGVPPVAAPQGGAGVQPVASPEREPAG
jgi:hypothetical protein